MRKDFNPDKSNEKLTECGKALSQELFIGSDGTLSVTLTGDECEVVSFIETPFGIAFSCKPK
jgi:hypothetical protein